MNYEFVMLKERAPFLVKELEDKITVGNDYKEDMVEITVNIERGADLLQIFHAGIKYGMEVMSSSRAQAKLGHYIHVIQLLIKTKNQGYV